MHTVILFETLLQVFLSIGENIDYLFAHSYFVLNIASSIFIHWWEYWLFVCTQLFCFKHCFKYFYPLVRILIICLHTVILFETFLQVFLSIGENIDYLFAHSYFVLNIASSIFIHWWEYWLFVCTQLFCLKHCFKYFYPLVRILIICLHTVILFETLLQVFLSIGENIDYLFAHSYFVWNIASSIFIHWWEYWLFVCTQLFCLKHCFKYFYPLVRILIICLHTVILF